jgi:protein-disulfide isomerase
MRFSFDRAVSLLIAVAAVAASAAFVHREFMREPNSEIRSSRPRPPAKVDNWERIVNVSLPITPNRTSIVIAEFGDFECPACRTFAPALEESLDSLRGVASAVFVHYPLPYHRFAKPAARAAECAARSGQFSALYHVLYKKQDSLGLKTWTSFGLDAGIPDTMTFLACMREANEPPRIQRGVNEGRRIAVQGTPTILINGWRLFTTPTAAEIIQLVRAIQAGDTLFTATVNQDL